MSAHGGVDGWSSSDIHCQTEVAKDNDSLKMRLREVGGGLRRGNVVEQLAVLQVRDDEVLSATGSAT